MHFRKDTGALIEVFCLEPSLPSDYAQNFQQTDGCSWLCMVGNLKKWKEGTLSRDIEVKGQQLTLFATRGECIGTSHQINFMWKDKEGKECDKQAMPTFAEILEAVGELPIPPYLNRATEESDKNTYQTVYSKIKGSVAAPTAGLHFTPRVLEALDTHGIEREELTLHVGAGTFKPVKSEEIGGHEMHTEYISVSPEAADTINARRTAGGRIIAVGTTSCRTLESVTDESGIVHPVSGDTGIFIYPGYRFKAVDALITNFHLPESTLLMLVSAFYDREHMMEVYRTAVEEKYRFFSFGDAMFIQ
jgi:S-adenosylmethionine:tRNA ribosyltransferase-isomerase